MSGARFLLLYLGAGTDGPWLRLDGGQVVDRGEGFAAIPLPDTEPEVAETVVGIVPGPDVAIHWVELPDLAEAQAAAAARLMASEVSAERLENLHVALSARREGEAERIMGVVGADRMVAWIAEAQAAGFDPDALVPETLLLEPPSEGLVTTQSGSLILARGGRQAFAAEPELIPLLADGAGVTPITADEVEARLPAVLASWPLDLRVGAFRKRRRWRIDWPLVRRLAMLAAACFLVNALIQMTLIAKYNADAERAEARTAAVARAALPRNTRVRDPQAQLAERLSVLRGGGIGLTPTLGGLFETLRTAPNVEVQALQFDPSGTLRVTLSAVSTGDLDLVRTALGARGLTAEPGDVRAAAGRQVIEYRITGA